ncbi:MAG: hypothetical protein RIS94_969 [Pseudomonadota bacterium]|jgi:hypothetical protein
MVIDTQPAPRWHDTGFDSRYRAACHFLALVRPEALADFGAGLARLQTRADFTPCVERALIDRTTLAALRTEADHLAATRPEHHDSERMGRTVVHDSLPFADLALRLAPLVGRLAGEAVEPASNLLALYGAEGRCPVHRDEPAAKWTLTLCLAQDEPWPLHAARVAPWPTPSGSRTFTPAQAMADLALGFTPLVTAPGDGLLYSGSAQWHYRAPRLTPNPHARAVRPAFCHLLMLHYRPARSADLVDPYRWAPHFGLPELGVLIEEHDRIHPGPRG